MSMSMSIPVSIFRWDSTWMGRMLGVWQAGGWGAGISQSVSQSVTVSSRPMLDIGANLTRKYSA